MSSHYLNQCWFSMNWSMGNASEWNLKLITTSSIEGNLEIVVCGMSSIMLSPQCGRVTHICVSKLTIIGSDNGLSPGRRQAIIWTNAGILLIGPLGTKFSEILIEIFTFSFRKMHLKMSSGKWRPFFLGPNVLKDEASDQHMDCQYSSGFCYETKAFYTICKRLPPLR